MEGYVSPELAHFVGRSLPDDESRYALLLRIFRAGLLLDPAYLSRRADPVFHFDIETDSSVDRLNFYPEPQFEARPHKSVDANEFVAPEMVCFCDIPSGQLQLHTKKYSRFGLAFPKPFLVSQGANPVWYVAKTARTRMSLVADGTFGDFFAGELGDDGRGAFLDRMKDRLLAWDDRESKAIQKALLAHEPGRTDPTALKNLLTSHVDLMIGLLANVFGFIKTFDPELSDEDPMNYYMEREWRVVGKVHFGSADVVRMFLPREFVERFRSDAPDFAGSVDAV